STASCTPGTSNMPTIFSASAGRITYGLARVLLPWWAATVHSPSSYARVTVRAGGAMHFIAMLGFGVEGTEIRYDVPLTTASAIIAVTVVAVGLFTAALGRPRVSKTLLGGVFAGFGVAAMHYTGMAAMRLDGDIG